MKLRIIVQQDDGTPIVDVSRNIESGVTEQGKMVLFHPADSDELVMQALNRAEDVINNWNTL